MLLADPQLREPAIGQSRIENQSILQCPGCRQRSALRTWAYGRWGTCEAPPSAWLAVSARRGTTNYNSSLRRTPYAPPCQTRLCIPTVFTSTRLIMMHGGRSAVAMISQGVQISPTTRVAQLTDRAWIVTSFGPRVPEASVWGVRRGRREEGSAGGVSRTVLLSPKTRLEKFSVFQRPPSNVSAFGGILSFSRFLLQP